MKAEIEHAMDRERQWRNLLRTMDCGSYCEDAASDAVAARRVQKAYQALVDELMAYERLGYKQPTNAAEPLKAAMKTK